MTALAIIHTDDEKKSSIVIRMRGGKFFVAFGSNPYAIELTRGADGLFRSPALKGSIEEVCQ
jgi:hypothetical protein